MSEATLEYVVDRLGTSPGRRLVTFREVGLPFWNIPIVCRIQEKKSLDALSEFVLRCVESGLHSAENIARFLGISLILVENTMAEMVSHNNLIPVSNRNESGVKYVLSPKGQSLSRELVEDRPRVVTIEFSFDGLTHEFGLVEPEHRWRPQDLKRNGILEIPAFPSEPPEVGPSKTDALQRPYHSFRRAKETQLMSALGVEGRRTKFFRKAVALVFQSVDRPDEYSIHFAVDGRRSEMHEAAFDSAEGLRKLGILDSLRSGSDPALEVLSPSILAQVSEEPGSETLRRATTTLKERAVQLQKAVAASGTTQRASLELQLESTTGQLIQAQGTLDSVPVRTLEVQEHASFLDRALLESKTRLLIVSPWIRTAVVTQEFKAKLVELLLSGVQVSIGYGIGAEARESPADKDGRQALEALQRDHPALRLVRLGNTHAKILASDHRFVIVTSFNWLSFKGDPSRPFRDERGMLVTVRTEIDKIFADYEQRMK